MIERRKNIPLDEFQIRYRQESRPVIIEHLVSLDQPALRNWTPDYLKQICGDVTVQVLANRAANPNYETNYDQHRKDMQFGDYVAWVQANPRSNDIYIHAQNQLMVTEAGKRLLPETPTFDYLDPARQQGGTFFWFGPADTLTPLHHDNHDIMFLQIYGRKQWMIFSPRQRHLLYNNIAVFSAVNPEQPDLSAYPLFRFASGTQFILYPGEALFLPVGWWHQVRALDVSISMSFINFLPNQQQQLAQAEDAW